MEGRYESIANEVPGMWGRFNGDPITLPGM